MPCVLPVTVPASLRAVRDVQARSTRSSNLLSKKKRRQRPGGAPGLYAMIAIRVSAPSALFQSLRDENQGCPAIPSRLGTKLGAQLLPTLLKEKHLEKVSVLSPVTVTVRRGRLRAEPATVPGRGPANLRRALRRRPRCHWQWARSRISKRPIYL